MFRNVGQMKRCKECARLDEMKSQAITQEERNTVAALKAAHIKEVMADRAINVRGNRISELDAQRPTADGHAQMVKLMLDGMDQAKFKVPRNLEGRWAVAIVCKGVNPGKHDSQ